MTDVQSHINASETPDEAVEPKASINRRRMFIAGAGIAGAAVVAKAGSAAAVDGQPVQVGEEYTAESRTQITITTGPADIAGDLNAFKGVINNATNGSHALVGDTNGDGHAVAGVARKLDNARGATWGRHLGAGAGIEGENTAENIPLAGPAHGALGIITKATNGSHAVLGKTMGAGHSIAGDTPAEAKNETGGPNTTAATWGRHQGIGAGIGGISVGGYGGEFKGATASVRLIPGDVRPTEAPTEATRKVGELLIDAAGNLWYNAADGGNFTRLNDQGGITMLTNPQRAYDSREEFPVPPATASNKGRHGANEIRKINLAEFTDLPVGATGAIINLTVAETAAMGFATVFNGDTADSGLPVASSINYVEAGMFVANGIIVPVGADGSVKVYTLTPTEVIIDVVGSISGPRMVTAPAT